MAFKYTPRNQESIEKRAAQQGGDFQSFIKDEFTVYAVKKGDNSIRIFPPTWDDPEHYGIDVFVHYQVGPDRASVLCPLKMENKPCPLCEAYMRAERQGDEELAKSLKVARRVLVWLLDRKEEEKGPLLWSMPWTVDRDIAKISRDKDSGEYYFIDDPDKGYNISFDREGEPPAVKYTGIQLARRQSSVASNFMNFVVEHPLPDVLKYRTYEEIKLLYEGIKATEEPNKVERKEEVKEEKQSSSRVQLVAQPTQQQESSKQEEDKEKEPPFEVETKQENKPKVETVSGSSRAQALRERFANRG